MSRIGKQPIRVPEGVKVRIDSDRRVAVEGPVGKLQWTYRPEMTVELNEAAHEIVVTRNGDDRLSRSLHGLTRSLIANMVEGCKNGFVQRLEVYGVGYGVQIQGPKFSLNCGLSHPAVFGIPAGVTVEVQTPQARGDSEPARFSVRGPDKQVVGEFAARVRRARPPEPYKGKGVRYAGEHIKRKAGKAFAGGGS
ncbi:MAG TPA: 50S ribosomal protein L6 [Phycisphaerae bacterium]|nr:50S ribosomal protein L6 [Phycisphaerae bacterium]